jgi:hypothetical protein
MFTSKDILVVSEEDLLEPREVQILDFLWDQFPLPRGQLQIKKSNYEMYDIQ